MFTPILTVCPNQICPTDAGPGQTLLLTSSGNLFGPGGGGGSNGAGAIYRMTPSGVPAVVASFCDDHTCHGGYVPSGPLVLAPTGVFYGTNLVGGGGANCTSSVGCGTAFRATAAGGGSVTKLHDFCSWKNCADGEGPAALIQATDGNLYGVTFAGGSSQGYGVVFRLTPSGRYSVVHTFAGSEGQLPVNALFQATDGNLYGTTYFGGVSGNGVIFRISLGLSPFVRTLLPAGKVGDSIVILGNGLTGSTSVTFNGTAATFTVVSDTDITATVPTGATAGKIQVVTPGGTLNSDVAFRVF